LAEPYLSVQPVDGLISITLDGTTADYLRYAIAILGEHVAGGLEVPPMSADMASRLGHLMTEIEDALRIR
jgi:hypothetical protein